MENRVRIEGSKERARDRGEDTLFAPAFASGKDMLTDPDVVESLVSSFMSEIAGVHTRYMNDEIEGPAATAETVKVCERYADIFMGRTDDYAPMPWNSPDGLGVYLVVSAGVPERKEDAVKAVLLRTAASFLNDVITPFSAGEIGDDAAKFRVEATKEDLVTLLLGLPAEEPEI